VQEDLTNEMVDLARQMKQSSLMMNQSVKQIEKVCPVSFVDVCCGDIGSYGDNKLCW
jgi:hypothetical protein